MSIHRIKDIFDTNMIYRLCGSEQNPCIQKYSLDSASNNTNIVNKGNTQLIISESTEKKTHKDIERCNVKQGTSNISNNLSKNATKSSV